MARKERYRHVGTMGGCGEGWGLVLVLVAERFRWGFIRCRTSHPTPGQAQGPHIRPTRPIVPTGRRGRQRPNEYHCRIRLSKFISIGNDFEGKPSLEIWREDTKCGCW